MKNYNGLKILITVLVLVQNLYSASFIMFRSNDYRSGEVYEIAKLTSTTTSMWTFEIQGQIFSSPVVKDNIVYFGGRDTSIWAINATNGEIVWQYSTSGFVDSTPLVYDGCLYFLSTDGKIYCFKIDLSSGEFPLLWSYDTTSKSCSSPLVTEDGNIIFVSGPYINGLPYGYIYILNAKTGSLIDKIPLGNFSYSSVSYYDGNLYFTTNDGYVCSYNLKLKKFNWRHKISSCLSYTTVVPYEDKLYFYAGDVESKVFVLSLDGVLISSSSRLSNIATDNTQVAVTTSTLIVNIYPTSTWEEQTVKYSSQTIICLNRQTLDILWRKDFKIKKSPEESYSVTSAVTVVNNIGYTGLNDGRFVVLDLTTGDILYQYNTNSTIICSPAVSNGWVYFTTVDGKIYGIKSGIFVSIVSPDVNDVVINSTTVKILSSISDTYELKCVNNNEQYLISSGVITSQQTFLNFDSRQLIDGKYKLVLRLGGISEAAKNMLYIDNSPLPPTNVSAVHVGLSKVLLTWSKSLDDGGGNNDVLFYNIYRSSDGNVFSVIDKVVSGTTFYFDNINIFGTTLYYKLAAEDKNSISEYSKVVSVYVPLITKPQPPTNLNAEIYKQYISSAEVLLSWTAAVDESTNVVKYNLYKSSNNVSFELTGYVLKSGSTVYSYIDVCVGGLTYYYYVNSENQYGIQSDSSNIVYIFVPQITKPLPPKNVSAYDTPDDQGGNITLHWEASPDENSSVAKVVSYKIYKSSNNISFVMLYNYYTVGKTSYTFYDTECPVGVTFYYYITAVNTFGLESDPSNKTSAFSIINISSADMTPPSIPQYVTALDYPNDDGTKIILIWSLSEDDGAGQNDVVKYKIYRNNMYLTYVPAGTTYYIDTNLTPNNTYTYYLTVVDKNNNESGGTQQVSCIPLADGIPQSVRNLVATVVCTYDGVYVVLRWNKSLDDAAGWNDVERYIVYRSTDESKSFIQLATLPRGTTFYIDSNCEVQRKYVYKVVVKDKDGYLSLPSTVEVITEYEILIKVDDRNVVKYIYSGEKLEIDFRQASLTQDVKLKIKTVPEFNILDFIPVSFVYKIETIVQELKFSLPVKIKIFYQEDKVKNVDKNKLRIYFYDEKLSKWFLVNSSKPNPQQGFVEAEVYHFSCFVVGVPTLVYDKIFKDEHVYAVPSPARGDSVNFRFIIYQPAKVKVYVYDIAGDFVWQSEEVEYSAQDVGLAREIKFNIKNLPTGLYIFRLEGKNEKGKQNVIKRFAVIH